MRVAVDVLRVESHHVQEAADVLLALLGVRHDVVDDERLRNDLSDGHAGVQGRIGVLEDELHVAAHLLELLLAHLRDVLALEEHRAAGGTGEVHDAAARGGLAAAGLSHQAEGLASVDVKRDVVDGVDGPLGEALAKDAGLNGELLAEVLHGEKRGPLVCH